jgi:parallel beta-helix repeat protein
LIGGAGLAAAPAGAGIPVSVGCGFVASTSIVLQNDIGPCHEDGILVGADNITIDLNGHQIFGEGGAIVIHQAAAVYSDNHSGVTIKNGTVHDFYHGIRVRQGSGNHVTRLVVRENIGGNGIVFETSTDNLAYYNDVIHNGRFAGISTFDTNSLPPRTARNTIAFNNLRLNSGVLFGSQPSFGISVENGSGHVVRGNTVDTSGRDGISISGGVGNSLIEGNSVRVNGANGINIRAGAFGNLIRGNTASGNAQRGILVAGTNNRIVGNNAFRNGVRDLEDTNANCDANVWSSNAKGTFLPACAGA